MSEVKLVIRDANEDRSGTVRGSVAEWFIAALSADPVSLTEMVEVKMYSHSRSKTKTTGFIATHLIQNNRVSFTASPVEYSEFALRMDSHFHRPKPFQLCTVGRCPIGFKKRTTQNLLFSSAKESEVEGTINRFAWEGGRRCLCLLLGCCERSNALAVGNESEKPICFFASVDRCGSC